MEPAINVSEIPVLVKDLLNYAERHINSAERKLGQDTVRSFLLAKQAKAKLAEAWLYLQGGTRFSTVNRYVSEAVAQARIQAFSQAPMSEAVKAAWTEVEAADRAAVEAHFPAQRSPTTDLERQSFEADPARKHRYLLSLRNLMRSVEETVAERYLDLRPGDRVRVKGGPTGDLLDLDGLTLSISVLPARSKGKGWIKRVTLDGENEVWHYTLLRAEITHARPAEHPPVTKSSYHRRVQSDESAADLRLNTDEPIRIDQGAIRGMPNELAPCLLLARRRAAGGGHPSQGGIFHFGKIYPGNQTSQRPRGNSHEGIILPLSLCRNVPLQRKLLDFAQLVADPATGDLASGEMVSASSRRAALQAWLNKRGLDHLWLLDKEPTCPWVRFEPVPEVFLDVLRQCEYVTALSDKQGSPIHILEHAGFEFQSHDELLNWAAVYSRSADWNEPFSLFLTSDLSDVPDMFSGSIEREMMFRPSRYAMRFGSPDPSVPSAKVGIRLEDEGDWAILDITLGEHNIEILLSEVYDPFPYLIEWLRIISMNDLPIGFEIDEEGTEKELIAHAFDSGRLLVAVLDSVDGTEFGAAVVDRDAFLAAFRLELSKFLGDLY